ncbi:MAG: 1-(5-phosphoribosyl)-5-[(5-phosphoribosylamino)methylideneamino]imidazole-4-carboxamide isomerase [Armatimonadota bacterium]|nr:1-(5-phosphoribosyl)-5-[(5-phosphoribosylamino)methylideneamino]imidazole-4-carboxamide isomerase [Armatimonadota bacterium]
MPTAFVVYPAIDLMARRAVRLRQGDMTQATVFDDDPVALARRWEAEGARWLHVVDLDGAARGTPQHLDLTSRICRAVRAPVQVGGGLRTLDALRGAFDAGAARAIIGTAALGRTLLFEAMREFGDRIAVALDARDGVVAVEGWQRTSAVHVVEAARRLADAGVARVIYTDIARDGMLTGPDLDGLRRLREAAEIPVIASGGIATLDSLRGVMAVGAEGAIIGRALYDGRLRLADALAVAGEAATCSRGV